MSTEVFVPTHGQRPDRFFTTEHQQRREELTRQWREAQDTDQEFPAEAQTELEQRVMTEVRAAEKRAAALMKTRSLST